MHCIFCCKHGFGYEYLVHVFSVLKVSFTHDIYMFGLTSPFNVIYFDLIPSHTTSRLVLYILPSQCIAESNRLLTLTFHFPTFHCEMVSVARVGRAEDADLGVEMGMGAST
jgi:hypothetical protein